MDNMGLTREKLSQLIYLYVESKSKNDGEDFHDSYYGFAKEQMEDFEKWLDGVYSTPIFEMDTEQQNNIETDLLAAGFALDNLGRLRKPYIVNHIGYILSVIRGRDEWKCFLSMKIGGNEDFVELPNVKSIDNILTLSQLLGRGE